jgi:hypothetical protein
MRSLMLPKGLGNWGNASIEFSTFRKTVSQNATYTATADNEVINPLLNKGKINAQVFNFVGQFFLFTDFACCAIFGHSATR